MEATLTGRELDAKIHAVVMQQEWDTGRCPACGWPFAESANGGCVAGNCSMRPTPDKNENVLPEYSASWGAVLPIIQKMFDRGWLVFEIRFMGIGFGGFTTEVPFSLSPGWVCFFARDFATYVVGRHADNPAMAICIAALKAIEKSEEVR